MISLLLIFSIYLNSVHIPFGHGKFPIEEPPCEKCLILKKILFNFIGEYVANETIRISFIVSKEDETPFQKALLDAVYSDPMLLKYPHNMLNALHTSSTATRRKHFNIIFIEESETLEYVILR